MPIGELAGELKLDDLEQGIELDGFDEKRWELAMGKAVHFVLDLIERHAGKQDDGEAGSMFLEIGEDPEAVEFRHIEVEEE